MKYFECFTANIAVQESKPLIDPHKRTIYDFHRGKWFSLGNPVVMQADPFLFVHGDTLFVFYEEMHLFGGHGVISMISTKDMHTFTKPVQITFEPECHFSYPMVFEDGGQVYMMPETGCDFNIRLYRAVSPDLTKFEPYKVILERSDEQKKTVLFDFADSCIYKKDGLYYLFTSYYVNNQYFMELYMSDHLEGPYKLHPKSPICSGNKYGRCGGQLIETEGHLYRPAQDCILQYGDQIHLLEIDELTPTSYREHTFKDNVLPKEQRKYKVGGHHVTFAYFGGKTVVATDAKHYCNFIVARMLKKTDDFFRLMRSKTP